MRQGKQRIVERGTAHSWRCEPQLCALILENLVRCNDKQTHFELLLEEAFVTLSSGKAADIEHNTFSMP